MTEATAVVDETEAPEQAEAIDQDTAPADAEPVEEAEANATLPDRELQMLREHDEAVRAIAEEAAELESEWESAKAVAKARKDALDECLMRLREAALRRPSYGPLFDKTEEGEGETEETSEAASVDWQSASIDELDVPDSLKAKLHGLDINTLGELSICCNEGGANGYQNIEGVGEKSAEKLEAAWLKWFAEHPAPKAEQTDQTQAEESASA